jgi:hypothetical protein
VRLPYMSAMSRPYSARFPVAPMMDWRDRRTILIV